MPDILTMTDDEVLATTLLKGVQLGDWWYVRQGYPENTELFRICWSPYGECVAEVVHGEENAKVLSLAKKNAAQTIRQKAVIAELVAELKRARDMLKARGIEVSSIETAIAKTQEAQ